MKKTKHKKKTWILDEDILIEGYKDKYGFHPNPGIQCGWGLQKINKDMINKTIFYSLDKAFEVVGNNINIVS